MPPIITTPRAAPDGMCLLRSRSGHYLPACDARWAWLIDPVDGRARGAVAWGDPDAATAWIESDPGSDPRRVNRVVVWAWSAPVAEEMFRDGVTGRDSL